MSLARELGEPVDLLPVLATEGLYELLTGKLEQARAAFAEQLRLCRAHDILDDVPQGLAGLAATAASQGQDERAARLLGAATALGPIGDDDIVAQLEKRFSRRLGRVTVSAAGRKHNRRALR